MSFIENSKQYNAGSSKSSSLFKDLGLKLHSNSSRGTAYYCPGEQANIGFYANSSSANLQIALSSDYVVNHVSHSPTLYSICTNFFAVESIGNSYWQKSVDDKVIYIRSTLIGDPLQRTNIIFAEMKNGDWGVIKDTTLYTKTGKQTIDDTAVGPLPNGEFTAVKMRNPETGVNFTSLYRVLSAPTFTPAGMYIDFGGKAFRAATVQTANDAEAKICFAFPVSD